jgi:hypothetical protein
VIKLYKCDGQGIRYWEAWDSTGKVVVHWGNLGDTGETREIRLKKGQSSAEIIANESTKPRTEGFQELPLDEHATVIVQYKTKGWGSSKDLDKRHKVEDILNECLGWTGNGHCDGGDIGSGSINAFSFVVDPHLAKDAIVAALKKEGLLKGAVIAFRRGDEDYTVLWPDDFEGEFSII